MICWYNSVHHTNFENFTGRKHHRVEIKCKRKIISKGLQREGSVFDLSMISWFGVFIIVNLELVQC